MVDRGIETRESSTGAKLLSAFPRALIPFNVLDIILPPGVQQLRTDQAAPSIGFKAALLAPYGGNSKFWQIAQNLRYRFSAQSLIEVNTGFGAISLESAGLLLEPQNATGNLGGAGGVVLSQAARLGTTTALAYGQVISVDSWDIDCNDITLAFPGAAYFQIWLQVILNNTDAVNHSINWKTLLQVEAAQFDSYRFPKWE